MNIITKALSDLSTEEYRACSRLNMRHNGMMMYSLQDNKNSDTAYAVMAWDTGRLIGWALLIPHGDDLSWYSTPYQRKNSKFVVQFYVRKACRRKGVGRLLMQGVNILDKTPTVIPHDRDSSDFFASYRVITDRGRRGLLTSAQKRKKAKAA